MKEARRAVSMIVGRDTENLTEEGVTKAAVETVAENTSDGVTAPLLYMMLGGAPLGFLYKAVNTMDSMLGYKNEKLFVFSGKIPAKMDDVFNFIPARVTAMFMVCASFLAGLDREKCIGGYICVTDENMQVLMLPRQNRSVPERLESGSPEMQFIFGEKFMKKGVYRR